MIEKTENDIMRKSAIRKKIKIACKGRVQPSWTVFSTLTSCCFKITCHPKSSLNNDGVLELGQL